MDKKISIVIVTYNSEKDIMDCLASIDQYNDIGDALEVIIVDNCSQKVDEMFQEIHQQYPAVKLIKNTKNGGYGAGNNIGIREASTPIIMIMNPDVRLIEPVFTTALKSFQDEHVVMYGMKQILPSSKDSASFFWTLTESAWLGTWLALKIFRPIGWYIQKKMYISGACFLVRKRDFEQVGLFDENLFLYAEEDDIRLRLLGLEKRRIVYDRTKRYIHFFDNRDTSLKKLQRLFISKCYLCKKNGISLQKPLKWEIQYCKIALWRAKCAKQSKQIIYKQWLDILTKNKIDDILSMQIQ